MQSISINEQLPEVLVADEAPVESKQAEGPVVLDASVLQLISGGGPLGGWLGDD